LAANNRRVRKLLLLVALANLAWAQSVSYGTVVKREVSALTVKTADGPQSFALPAKTELPAWVTPGRKVKVTFQELRVAVRTPNGQRECRQAYEFRSVAPWDGRLPDPGRLAQPAP